jgi:flagellum-specific peptidoglycan hydrolase FlgJ
MKNYIIIAVLVIALYLLINNKDVIMEEVQGILTRAQFIERYKDAVKQAAKGTGLFPSLFMAQAILESADSKGNPGNSGLAKKGNNFFGIKADKSWKGLFITLPTREVINGKDVIVPADFRKYSTVLDSFKARVKFLQTNARYPKAGVFSAPTPEAQAMALQKAGYATDPKYAEILTNLIKKHNLKTLDV